MRRDGGPGLGSPGAGSRQLREPALRTDRLIKMMAGRIRPGRRRPGGAPASGMFPGAVLLVGEAEGLLAARLAGERGARVTWYEPVGHHAEAHPLPAPCPGTERLAGSPYEMPFGDGEFDAAASQFTVEFLEEPRRALAEWGRVLADGGVLVVVCRNVLFTGSDPMPRRAARASFSPRGLRDLLESSGFEVRQACTLIPDLKAPRVYRGNLGFSYAFERLPYFRDRGMLLFASAVRRPGGIAFGGHGGP